MASKRPSTVPPLPKPPTSFSSSLTIAENASLTGTHLLTIGSNTVIHPRTKITTSYAPLTIGNNCIIAERSSIGCQSTGDEDGMTIEDGVVIEAGAVVEAKRLGEGSVVEINATIGKGAVLGKHCKIGPLCEIAAGEVLPEFTVVYGNNLRRTDYGGIENLKMQMVRKQADVLKKLINSNVSKFQ